MTEDTHLAGETAAPTFSIGPIVVRPNTVLAPMAGVTDTVFRRLIRKQGGCGLLMTEFTSSHGVVSTRTAKKPNRNFPTCTSSRTSTRLPASSLDPIRT